MSYQAHWVSKLKAGLWYGAFMVYGQTSIW